VRHVSVNKKGPVMVIFIKNIHDIKSRFTSALKSHFNIQYLAQCTVALLLRFYSILQTLLLLHTL
jgi:hypothetical protein